MKKMFTFMKHVDKSKNRLIIPKFIVEKYGRDFYLEVYNNGKMMLRPVNFEKRGK